ncbi:MAG: peptidylprolyl isomerase, partial [Gammaproteobacteria bacterium]|nr:peptidylprolyl isomerase [Gammaproteobacteria bacterium]
NGLLNNRGTIATARLSDPHSATSQFFINTVDNDFLNYRNNTSSGWGYAVFGQVVNGMEVVDEISKVSTGSGGPFTRDVPNETIKILKASVLSCDPVKQ